MISLRVQNPQRQSTYVEGREIELVQMHKAEEDIAVAAASVLARDAL